MSAPAPQAGARRHRARTVLAAVVAVAVLAAVVAILLPLSAPRAAVVSGDRATPAAVADSGGTIAPFRGLGAWADITDYAPDNPSGTTGAVTPATVQLLASYGVHTLFLQTAVPGPTGPALVDPALLAQFLGQAHQHGMTVIGWYQPGFTDPAADLKRLEAIADFRRGGQRFDGIAVDIEVTHGMPDAGARTSALVTLSHRLRAAVGKSYPLAAITVPPLILTTIAPNEWPGFPWHALKPVYDVWIPMSYWTFRNPGTRYADPQGYTLDNITATRRLLGDPNAAVYALGGVGDRMKPGQYQQFLAGAAAGHAIGAAIFDYRSTSPAGMQLLSQVVPADGFAAPARQLRDDPTATASPRR